MAVAVANDLSFGWPRFADTFTELVAAQSTAQGLRRPPVEHLEWRTRSLDEYGQRTPSFKRYAAAGSLQQAVRSGITTS